MKKLILIIILLFAVNAQSQWFGANPKQLLRLSNTWDSTQRFGHVIIDSSLTVNGKTTVDRYNYLYARSIQLVDGDYINWSSGSEAIKGTGTTGNYSLNFYGYDGTSLDTTMIINGIDSSVTIFGTLYPSNNFAQNIGTSIQYFNHIYSRYVTLDNVYSRTTAGLSIGSGSNPITLLGVAKIQSVTFSIDSIGANKSDTAKIGKHYWLANCDNTNNDTVYLADVGITDGFTVQVKKLDANATYVVVMPKGGKTIEGTTEDKFNTQYQTRKYVYKNNTWWIF